MTREVAVVEIVAEEEEIIERVAALDIGKAALVCCVRIPERVSAGLRRCAGSRR